MKWILFFLLCFSLVFADSSLQQSGYHYIFPKPGSSHVSQHASLLFRFQDDPHTVLPKITIKIVGENGVAYSGELKIASDNQTVSFQSDKPFIPGELVRVSIQPQTDGLSIQPVSYSFQIAQHEKVFPAQSFTDTLSLAKKMRTLGNAMIMANGVSVPGDFPCVDVSVNTTSSDGYIFVNNIGGSPYTMLLDNEGAPVWYIRTSDDRRDFKVQKNGLLTMLVRTGYSFDTGFIALDSTFTEVATFHAVDGCVTDEHELQVLQDGHYLLFGLKSMTVDMSKIISGGHRNAIVYETGIQEFTPEGDLIFQWRAWDHFDPLDMFGYSPDDLPTDASFRFPHMNSIDIDDDGNIILSSKRLSEITKIDRQTGEIIWRLGGAHNEFEFVNDPFDGFFNQHSVRVLGNGHYTIMDNGCLHNPAQSRAIEYEIDTEKMTATLVWSFQENPPTYAYHMGNVQRLPNGNTLINWAVQNLPKAQEVTPDGEVVYEMNFAEKYKTYRTFRFPWNGVAKVPNLIIEQTPSHVELLFNKFGDSDVDHYNIYADQHSRPTTLIATSQKTMAMLNDFENNKRYYFRVTAVNSSEEESDFSLEKSIVITTLTPGQQLVNNGDFSSQKSEWKWLVRGDAAADWSVEDKVLHIKIDKGGENDHDIQLTQEGVPMIDGQKYVFEFDAWSDRSRSIEMKIAQNGSPFTDYSQLSNAVLTRGKNHYAYEFTVQGNSDPDARIVFNLGLYDYDVYLDNVSLKFAGATNVDKDMPVTANTILLHANYPNPFNAQTTIGYEILEPAKVKLFVFNTLGQNVATLVNEKQKPGVYSYHFNSNDLSSGVYFYCLELNNKWQAVNKMLLVK